MKRTEMTRSPIKKTYRPTGPDRLTVETVFERDRGQCGWCGHTVSGERGRDWSIGHRRPRRMGGDRRPDTNLPSNLIILDGDGTTQCHGALESHRSVSYDRGFILRQDDQPSQRAIEHALHGWVYLTDDGAVCTDPPEFAA